VEQNRTYAFYIDTSLSKTHTVVARFDLNIDGIAEEDRTNALLAARDMAEQALNHNAVLSLYIDQDKVGDVNSREMDVDAVRRHFKAHPPFLNVADLPGTVLASTKRDKRPDITINRRLVRAVCDQNDGGLSFRRYCKQSLVLCLLITTNRLVVTIFVTILHEISHYKVRYNGEVDISPREMHSGHPDDMGKPESGSISKRYF
jgi:hypothetical protein